ncbi:GntR family transcriptional regulator [Orbus sturtevantii]|uniref:GntR family transcriptional regulator n=1 Tax=Orbus sturtevantii TaxID=3074109 RepID=UPI00370D05AE
MIYKKIAHQLRKEINSSKYAIGDQLPNEKELSSLFNASRMTVRKAINELINFQLISREWGRGTFIIAKDLNFGINQLKSFSEIMNDAHKGYINKVIEFSVTSNINAVVSNKLKLSEKDKVFYIRRIRYINNNPIMVEDSYMPYNLFKGLTVSDMENSKFNYIENICGIKIEGSYETSYAIIPDKEIRELLCLNIGRPILMSTTYSYDTNNQFINYAIIYRNSQEHIYEFHLKR